MLKTALIVDDSRLARLTLKRLLMQYDIEVSEADQKIRGIVGFPDAHQSGHGADAAVPDAHYRQRRYRQSGYGVYQKNGRADVHRRRSRSAVFRCQRLLYLQAVHNVR